MKKVLGPNFDRWCKERNQDPQNLKLSRPKSDRPQNEPEFKGRVAIFEVMNVSEAVAKLILQERPASELEDVAISEGSLLMKQDGYLKVLEGMSTIEEVKRVAEI